MSSIAPDGLLGSRRARDARIDARRGLARPARRARAQLRRLLGCADIAPRRASLPIGLPVLLYKACGRDMAIYPCACPKGLIRLARRAYGQGRARACIAIVTWVTSRAAFGCARAAGRACSARPAEHSAKPVHSRGAAQPCYAPVQQFRASAKIARINTCKLQVF